MNNHWHENTPIYKQLVDKLKATILQGVYPEGSALPSVRVISAELQINHITVSKSYHELVDAGLVEKRRGLGMFVKQGAIQQLMLAEQASFMNEELPQLLTRMAQLQINPDDVIALIKKQSEGER
jgi:GntR family transcriptional regulator